MPVMTKLIAHTQNFFLMEEGNLKKAFTRRGNKEALLSEFQNEWLSERKKALSTEDKYTPERLSGWSLYNEKVPPHVELFVVQGRKVDEDGKLSGDTTRWFTGGKENCKCFLAFLYRKGGLINNCEWELEIVPHSKPRRNYEQLVLGRVLQEEFEVAGDDYYLSKNPNDFNLYSMKIIEEGHKTELSKFDSVYKALDAWQASLLNGINFVD